MAGPSYSVSEAYLATLTIETLLQIARSGSSEACGVKILGSTAEALTFRVINQVDLGREIYARFGEQYRTKVSGLNGIATAREERKAPNIIGIKEENLRKDIDAVWKALIELGYLKYIDKANRHIELKGFDLAQVKTWRQSILTLYAQKNEEKKSERKNSEDKRQHVVKDEGAEDGVPIATNPPNDLPRRSISAEGFFGRGEKLKEMQDKLVRLGAAIALSGMAGAGKTELAIQLAYESMRYFPGGICWISVCRESRSSEEDVFNLICDHITSFARSILEIKIPDDKKLPIEQLRYCLRNWRKGEDIEGKVLIVIDDVQIYEHLRRFLDEISRFPRFRMLVTSRFVNTGQLHLERIDVDVLETVDALKFLKYLVNDKRVDEQIIAPSTGEKTVAIQLCERVGNLPLGLQCLGTFLRIHKDITISDLLEELNQLAKNEALVEHEGLMFGEETRIGITARRGIIAALDLTWNILSDNDRILGKVIGCVFFTDSLLWKLVEKMIERVANSDPSLAPLKDLRKDQLRGAREKLIAYSLLKAEDDREARYRIHVLVLQYFKYKKKQGD